MTADPACRNHPGRKALSFCHACGHWFCGECLEEGGEYYYCRNPECQGKKIREEAAPEPPAAPRAGEPDDLVTVATYFNPFTAQLARTKLESEGLEALVLNEYMGQVMPAGGGMFEGILGGVQLKTRKSQAERAYGILRGGG